MSAKHEGYAGIAADFEKCRQQRDRLLSACELALAVETSVTQGQERELRVGYLDEMRAAIASTRDSDLSDLCGDIIRLADAAGVELDDGNVVDLCADQLSTLYNVEPTLLDIRTAIVVAGFGPRFPKAVSRT